jgi:Leucine-rich repeat (LRR) protein
MKESILALLYSVEETNIELAEQLILGLEEGSDKADLQLIYSQLREAAAYFQYSVSALLLALADEQPLELYFKNLLNLLNLPSWLAALSGRIRQASLDFTLFELITVDLANPDLPLENIVHLQGLQTLTINIKRPEEIAAFCGLSSLENLCCYCREGGALPENIGQLTNLKQLSLHCDEPISLPESFFKLCQLSIFDCQYPIAAAVLGRLFLALPSLRVLSIDARGLIDFPKEVRDTNLEVLLMNHYSLSDLRPLPPSLKDLELTQVQNMQAIPAAIFALPNLEELRLAGIMMENLGAEILTLAKSIRLIHIEASLLSNSKANYWHERLHRAFPEADIYIEGV